MEMVNVPEIKKDLVNFLEPHRFKTARLRKKIIKTYLRLGETNETIEAINILIGEYFCKYKKSRYFEETKKHCVEQMLAKRCYQHRKLMDGDLVSISIHAMQKGDVIPMHAHPGMFNVTVVDQGVFKINYASIGNLHSVAANDGQLTLYSNQVSSGLPVKNNMHEIQAATDNAVFYSVRIKLPPGKLVRETYLFQNSLLITFILPVFTFFNMVHAIDFTANGANQHNVGNKSGQINLNTTVQYRQRAEKLRLTNDYVSQVEAIKIYEKAAYDGDAESQYWLGVMYLDGSGITEDDDVALEWISKAAKQNYSPAEKLLEHLLATDFDMDC